MVTNTISAILSQWHSESVNLNPPATEEAIRETEAILGIIFPEDLKHFYLKADGFKNGDWLSNMYSLWPLKRMIEEHSEIDEYKINDPKNFVGFCDYLINCHQVGFLKDRPGIFKSYDLQHPIAQTFDELVILIHEDSDLIY